jgi:hypothetical protein
VDVCHTNVIGHARKAMYARIRRASGSKMSMIKVSISLRVNSCITCPIGRENDFGFFSFELMPILKFKQILQEAV